QFSGTYTLEAGVDELDGVRYDGSLLYVAPQRAIECCFIARPAEEPGAEPAPPVVRAVRILRTDVADASAREVGRIPLENGVSVQGMYTSGTTLVALTSEAYYGSYGPFWTGLPYWAPTRFGIRFYDVASPATPRLAFAAEIDGVFVDSRRIGDRVYLVSRYAPRALLDANREAALAGATLNDLLPQVTIGGASRPLVDPARCYVTSDRSGSAGAAVITSITVVPIGNPGAMTTTCYDEEAYGVYVSEQAVYLTQQRTVGSAVRTRVHRFDIGGGPPAYRGSAEVDGAVWTGGQNDFRMNEFEGRLRLFTTEFVADAADGQDHRLYVLQPRANAPELEVVSQLPNTRRPEEIGKPGEALYGVRFRGRRAYAVTFRQVDPLYVLDLSNPADPAIAGALELPGFSDFLHPVSEQLLLGLGRADTGGVRLALFDVSSPGRPRERGGLTLGGAGSHSEARFDRHAFAYLAGGSRDRFAIPVDRYAEDGSFRFERSALELFEVHDQGTPALATLHAVGAIVSRRADAAPATAPVARSRAFIADGTVYYVADDAVYGAPWSAPESARGPF
ncbi:MAG: beta-propeller domain-containing protein, partial [Pseudomonadota bacterium]